MIVITAQMISIGKKVPRRLLDSYPDVRMIAREAMRDLARSFRPEQLSTNAFRLYEKVRPANPEGVRGWGDKANLDIDRIRSLAVEK
jgi:hypothetical protein